MTETLADREARECIRNELDRTLVVEAAAGTGKTTALVSRIIEVIRRGKGELSGLVAVTFTEKAAGELKLRLRSELERARSEHRDAGDGAITARLERGLAQLEEAHIGTIHGFCADLLKQRPLQAGVDPRFEVATEDETERMSRRVFDRWLEEKLADPPPGVRRLLRRPASRDTGPVDDLYQAGRTLIDIRDFPTRWQVRPFDRESMIDDLVERVLRLDEIAGKASSTSDYLYRDFEHLRAFVQELRAQERISQKRDYDLLEHLLPSLTLGRRKGRGAYGEGVVREDLIAEREALVEAFSHLRRACGADLAAHLQNELQELVARYEAFKEKRGRLDFLDLLERARTLLRDRADVRAELQQAFTHVFVDEFQDTDPLQAELLLLLTADDPAESDWQKARPAPGKLFVVADPKQSIYRFRRADVALYEKIKRRLLSAGAKPVYLTTSFRSVPALQELVNASMSEVMKPTADNHQASYVRLDRSREAIADQPSVVALPVPRPYGDYGTIVNYAIERSEPQAVAAWVRWVVEQSGWRVSVKGDEAPRPVTPSDVCLLFRRFRSFGRNITEPYVEALQGLDVPHVLVGGRGFHQREEIEAMRVALTALERPDDELSVFATLRGPLFSLPDESLFLFRTRHGSLHPFRDTKELDGDDASVRDALDVLARLHAGRNHRPIALTLRELLDANRAQAGFALWQAGDQVLANVLRLLQLARNFEEAGGLSFRGFVDHLDGLAEAAGTGEQPMAEDGVEGVRLMTVHRAKGLEFPIVVLCDVTCFRGGSASRHVDPDRKIFAVRVAGGAPWELLDEEERESAREEAETLRLLYVAATRARDVLAVPVVADQPYERGWVGPLLPALYPESKTQRLPTVGRGLPRFTSEECVIDRPARSPVPPGSGIRPGVHRPKRGEHEVAWWDPALFELDTATKPGLRRYWILKADPEEGPGEGARAHADWLEARERLLARGGEASLSVTTVTRRAEEPDASVPGEERVLVVEVPGRDPQRPSGKRFGTLVHELLARSPLDADPASVEKLARSLGRVFGASDEEIAAAAEAGGRALAHELLERARQAKLCYRELPLVHRERAGVLVEGVPDLVLRADESSSPWTVVDFKTDLRVDMSQETYRRQVALYVQALEAMTGDAVEGVLFFV